MLIFTNKELHEEVLEQNVYIDIYEDYKKYLNEKGTILHTIKKLSSPSKSKTAWFKNQKNLRTFLDKIEKYKEPKNNELIPINTYKDLMEFLGYEKNSNDNTIKSLISILKSVLNPIVCNSIGIVDLCLNSPSFTNHRGLCQNINCLSCIRNKTFYSNNSVIKAMGILLDALIKIVDNKEKLEKLARDPHSNALKSIESALGHVAADTNNPFYIHYVTLVTPYFWKVQETLEEHGVKIETNFKIEPSKIIK